MRFDKESYKKEAGAHASRSPVLANSLKAFVVGGGICALSELIYNFFNGVLRMGENNSSLLLLTVLIFTTALLTGIGVFDKIAKFAGAGTLVPITGFANAVVSPALDTKVEGMILGIGAKIFTVAGPVLLFGTLSGAVYGVIYYLVLLFSGTL